ncbi:C39 family peptidase [Gloeothece verrucosa]|uniref:Peptidase C39-like domain-containing protein n=1 Tax=Gloeothece verrucosa (strain PCC 7822) TaxID=497965 RepID=E0UB87_GLOV7|nr:C39 family peptidase [Gloeothece verrucosa]ADN16332.1 hypothetical protein Cyan7822_4418 [Gloeothece verrucosa PCC 7822]
MTFRDFSDDLPDLDSSLDEGFYSEPESTLFDLDNDGTFETTAQGFDTNGDGIADHWSLQTDLDGDGIADETNIIEGLDSDGDGIPDTWEMSINLDNEEMVNQSAYFQDTDGDSYPHFLETSDFSNTIGDPAADMEHWHQQTYQDTCAIASQEFILDELTGQDFSEDELRQEAIDNGWYLPGGGTPLDSMGNLLEAHGIDVAKQYNCTFKDLNDKLAQGEKVIVAVDAEEIWYPDRIDTDDLIANALGMPGQGTNHAIQVIGIDNSNPDHPMVILNDPGSPNGQGMAVPAEQFINAWEDSGNYMVSTTGHTAVATVDAHTAVGEQMVGNYADASYYKGKADSQQEMAKWYAEHGDFFEASWRQKAADEYRQKAEEAAKHP